MVSVESVGHQVVWVEFLHDGVTVGLGGGSVDSNDVLLAHPSQELDTVGPDKHPETFLFNQTSPTCSPPLLCTGQKFQSPPRNRNCGPFHTVRCGLGSRPDPTAATWCLRVSKRVFTLGIRRNDDGDRRLNVAVHLLLLELKCRVEMQFAVGNIPVEPPGFVFVPKHSLVLPI